VQIQINSDEICLKTPHTCYEEKLQVPQLPSLLPVERAQKDSKDFKLKGLTYQAQDLHVRDGKKEF
jgi:hypothetical protein